MTAILRAGPVRFEVELVIFDKDGTLFDFRSMWARIFQLHVESLRTATGNHPGIMADVYASMGYDPGRAELDPYGPLALATYEEIRTILSLVLYRHGWGWDDATKLVEGIMDTEAWPPLEELVKPIGDLPALFKALSDANIQVGVVTTDNRDMTEAMLRMAGVHTFVSAMACADDGYPLKPAPDGIHAICKETGVSPKHAVMVGDSPTDMLAAQEAGLAGRVGVLTGVSRRERLEPHADVVLDSIAELVVETPSTA